MLAANAGTGERSASAQGLDATHAGPAQEVVVSEGTTMTRLERRLLPATSRQSPIVPVSQAIVDGAEWRGSALLRQTHFFCSQCRKATQYTGEEVNGVGICGVCNSAVAIVSSRAETAEMQALSKVASSTAVGRRYKFLQGRSQTNGPATIVARDSPNYTSYMIASTFANGATRDGRTEARPRDGVATFDSWLCVVTAGAMRAYTREDVTALVRNPSAEGLLIEFLLSMARTVDVMDEEGVRKTVQVCRSSNARAGICQCRKSPTVAPRVLVDSGSKNGLISSSKNGTGGSKSSMDFRLQEWHAKPKR